MEINEKQVKRIIKTAEKSGRKIIKEISKNGPELMETAMGASICLLITAEAIHCLKKD